VPELPEVETICRQLRPELVGRAITGIEILDERWTRPVPPELVAAPLQGRHIESVHRRGKYILVGLDDGATLAMHLRMTGNLLLEERRLGGERLYEGELPGDDPDRHLRARLDLDDDRCLRFIDARRFGHASLLEPGELDAWLDERLGVEPLAKELTPELIGRLAAARTVPLKSFLLDQRGIAGIGNIYADEALYRAGLHPLSPAGSMRREHWERLREGIVDALELGISNGGSSIDDYRDARGQAGTMQQEFLVHTREGEPCRACGESVSRIVVGGRSTYFCASCQTRLRPRRRKRSALAGVRR
jgi:formamidopyrimidine-DNA glycosylase